MTPELTVTLVTGLVSGVLSFASGIILTIINLSKIHAKEMTAERESSAKELASVRADHAAETARINKDHATEMSALVAQYQSTLSRSLDNREAETVALTDIATMLRVYQDLFTNRRR